MGEIPGLLGVRVSRDVRDLVWYRPEVPLATAPAPASSITQKMFCVRENITCDDTGLKVGKSVRLLWVFLWEGKDFRGETVHLIEHQKLFSEAKAGAVRGARLTMETG